MNDSELLELIEAYAQPRPHPSDPAFGSWCEEFWRWVSEVSADVYRREVGACWSDVMRNSVEVAWPERESM
jgi:hypothetical protein